MKTFPFILVLLTTPPLLAQTDIQEALQKAQGDLDRAQSKFALAQIVMPRIDIEGVQMALKSQTDALFQFKGMGGRFDGGYDAGTRALDDHNYEDAVRKFDAVIEAKQQRTDGALYWRAYALNRLGRRDEAVASLAALRRDYPASHWLNDAQALEAEVKQGSGQAVSPAQESNDDLKLLALASLVNADPDRAFPLLDALLKGGGDPRLKQRAMFVLTQSRSPRARQLLADYAKGAGNPDLQIHAIRYLGMSGTPEDQQQMQTIYASSNDAGVKREIIHSLGSMRAPDALFTLAKTEKDESLRADAIMSLGAMRATDQLSQLYAAEPLPKIRSRIIQSLFAANATDKLQELIKTEKDSKVRGEAFRSLAMSRSVSPESVTALYSSETDPQVKREVINGLSARGDAKPLIDLARRENDPVVKRAIVQRLTTMHSKEATDYMLELLK